MSFFVIHNFFILYLCLFCMCNCWIYDDMFRNKLSYLKLQMYLILRIYNYKSAVFLSWGRLSAFKSTPDGAFKGVFAPLKGRFGAFLPMRFSDSVRLDTSTRGTAHLFLRGPAPAALYGSKAVPFHGFTATDTRVRPALAHMVLPTYINRAARTRLTPTYYSKAAETFVRAIHGVTYTATSDNMVVEYVAEETHRPVSVCQQGIAYIKTYFTRFFARAVPWLCGYGCRLVLYKSPFVQNATTPLPGPFRNGKMCFCTHKTDVSGVQKPSCHPCAGWTAGILAPKSPIKDISI